jgi:DNA-binding PadR family transcriptional regulator
MLTLSAKESLILELLVGGGELYGLQVVGASRRRLKRGTVYVTLGRMEEKGYISSRLEDAPADVGGMPRRLYR